MRRYGEQRDLGQTYTPRPGVYAILPIGGKLLVTHQAEPEPEFQLPGGGVDPGESTLHALHREVMEETGWRIANPRRFGVYRRFTYMPEYDMWAEKTSTTFFGPDMSMCSRANWWFPGAFIGFLQGRQGSGGG